MAKSKLTLSIDEHLVNVAKKDGLNISGYLEECLAKKYNIKKEVVWVSAG